MAFWKAVIVICFSTAFALTPVDCSGIVQTEVAFNSYGRLLALIHQILEPNSCSTTPLISVGTVATGMDQRYWPDLIYSNATFAKGYILSSGIVSKVYVQDATAGATTSPEYGGSRDDVWLYTDGIDNIIYQIPSRGLWHPNSTYCPHDQLQNLVVLTVLPFQFVLLERRVNLQG